MNKLKYCSASFSAAGILFYSFIKVAPRRWNYEREGMYIVVMDDVSAIESSPDYLLFFILFFSFLFFLLLFIFYF